MKNQKPISKKKNVPKPIKKNPKNTPVKDAKDKQKHSEMKNTPHVEDDVDTHDETSNKIKSRDELRNKNTDHDKNQYERDETESETDEETPEISDEYSDDGPHE